MPGPMSTGGYDTLILRAPLGVNYISTNSDGSTANINAYSYQFSPADFIPGSGGMFGSTAPIQASRLAWMFNLWQEYRMKNIHYHFVPRWNLSSQPVPAVTTPTTTGTTLNPQLTNGPDAAGSSASYQNNIMLTFLGDPTDVTLATNQGPALITGSNTAYPLIDEMWGAQTMPNARMGSNRDHIKGSIIPMEMDITAATARFGVVTGNTTVGQGSSPSYTIQNSASSPQPNSWKSTRTQVGSGQPPSYNTADGVKNVPQEYLGMKFWIYNPFNSDTGGGGATYAIGQLYFSYEFEFRGREFRTPLGSYSLSGMNPEVIARMSEAEKKLAGDSLRFLGDTYGKFGKRKLLEAAGIPEEHDLSQPPPPKTGKSERDPPPSHQSGGSQQQTPLQSFQARKR